MFKLICPHPLKFIHVRKNHEEKVVDDDFSEITYYLYCLICDKEFDVSYSKLRYGVDAFLSKSK